MSLKAKLEAVIYAAEEPVTLPQLAILFAEDVIAWKAERDAEQRELMLSVASGEGDDGASGPSDATPALQNMDEILDVLSYQESGAPESIAALAVGQESENVSAPELGVAVLEVSPETNLPAADVADQAVDEVVAQVVDPVAEAKRQERAREREVREILRGVLDELIAEYAEDSRGIEIREIAGGFRMSTKPETHDAVRAFVKSLKPPMKLSLPALETLAVIAYKQPVTAPEVGEIRGVDSAGVLGSLMSRKLIATAGRKQVIGRPMLYKTTKEFLMRFGLKDLSELPSMEEFEKMAALELNEESLEGESMEEEQAEPVEQSGDLFAPEDTTGGDLGKGNDAPPTAPTDTVDTGGDLSKGNMLEAHRTSGDLSKANIAMPTNETKEP